jgi:DNA relaxase NicK
MDDYSKSVDFWDIESALIIGGKKEGDKWNIGNFAGFKSWRVVYGSDGGKTIYLGSPQSDEQVRIYDKEIESKGQIKSIRMERVLKDERAEQAFDDWMNISPDEYETTGSMFCISAAIGKTKFINRTGWAHEKNLDRIPLLPWWEKWTKDIVPTGYSKPKLIRALEKANHWVDEQVMRTIAMIKRVYGDAFDDDFARRLKAADKRLTPKQEHLADEWRAILQHDRRQPVEVGYDSLYWREAFSG